jgi:hypothetical protein
MESKFAPGRRRSWIASSEWMLDGCFIARRFVAGIDALS